jgi:ubiquinone/menaquinone biosynthesis C-methylase UbiE
MSPDSGYRDLDRSASFDKIVASLDHFNADPSVKAVRRILYRVLRPRPGMRILDAGCGPGYDLGALAPKVGPGGLVFGLDLSQRMIDLARRRLGAIDGVDFKAASIEATGLPTAGFDASFALRTVRYLDEPINAIRELARVTKPGGLVAVVEGAMGDADLPAGELSRFVFGPKTSLAVRLPNLFRACGLEGVTVKPSFTTTTGRTDPQVLEYAKSQAEVAVDEGVASAEEAESWLAELSAIIAENRWFSADCIFIVLGTVPAG